MQWLRSMHGFICRYQSWPGEKLRTFLTAPGLLCGSGYKTHKKLSEEAVEICRTFTPLIIYASRARYPSSRHPFLVRISNLLRRAGGARLTFAASNAPIAFRGHRESFSSVLSQSLFRPHGEQRRMKMEATAGDKTEKKATGHQPPGGQAKEKSPEEIALAERIQAHQDTAARPSKTQGK